MGRVSESDRVRADDEGCTGGSASVVASRWLFLVVGLVSGVTLTLVFGLTDREVAGPGSTTTVTTVETGNQEVLEEFARVLRPGGKLGIETIHHDGFVRRFTPAPFASTTFRDEDVMIDTSVFDPVTGRIQTDRIVYRSGAVRKSQHQVRLPTIPEFERWLTAAGFVDMEYFGREQSPPTVDDVRVVVVATR